jgi:hypothetical protein
MRMALAFLGFWNHCPDTHSLVQTFKIASLENASLERDRGGSLLFALVSRLPLYQLSQSISRGDTCCTHRATAALKCMQVSALNLARLRTNRTNYASWCSDHSQ